MDWARFLVSDFPVPRIYTVPACKLDSSSVDTVCLPPPPSTSACEMNICSSSVKKQPSQDVLHGDEAEEELGLARLVSSYTLPHQNSQPGGRGRQTARSKVLSRRAKDT